MTAQVTSVFLYVDDVQKSLEFYNEIVGAEIAQLHAEVEGGPLTLAILKIGNFSLMLHPQDEHAEEFTKNKAGVGIHLQIRVDDVDAFYTALPRRRGDARRLRRAGRPGLGLARVRPQGPQRLRLVDLPGQVGRPVDLIGPTGLLYSSRSRPLEGELAVLETKNEIPTPRIAGLATIAAIAKRQSALNVVQRLTIVAVTIATTTVAIPQMREMRQ